VVQSEDKLELDASAGHVVSCTPVLYTRSCYYESGQLQTHMSMIQLACPHVSKLPVLAPVENQVAANRDVLTCIFKFAREERAIRTCGVVSFSDCCSYYYFTTTSNVIGCSIFRIWGDLFAGSMFNLSQI
jgi:hypothetical protein